MISIFKGIFGTCLFLLYPYLVYKGMENGMAWIAPTFFSGLFLLQAFRAKTTRIKIIKASISITLLLGAYYLQTITAKAMPIFIQLMLMYFFGRTLFKGKGPSFIESFVRLEFPEFPAYVSAYCTNLTILWTAFFAMNAVICLLLAIWGTTYWWTLYNGLIIYLMIGLLSIGEYIYRHYKFPEFVISDPISSVKTMFTNGRKIWMDVQTR